MKTKTVITIALAAVICCSLNPALCENTKTSKNAAVMATINGQPVYMDQLVDILVDGYGMAIAQQIISTELVRQSAATKDITASDAEIKAEHDQTLKLTFPSAQNDSERTQMFERLLQTKNLTRKTWDLVMVRNALLRKMLPKDFEIPKQAIDDEISRRFGRKVVVRHIELNSLQKAQLVKGLAEKADFQALAQQYSLNPSRNNGGLLPPIGEKTMQVSPALRQVALAMSKVGQVSDPIQVSNRFHILKLEKIIPPQQVSDEKIRNEVIVHLKQIKLRNESNRLFQNIIKAAKIEFVNPILKLQSQKY